jgi:hypothetical protein
MQRVYQNMVLGGIFGPKRGEIIGGWRRLHSEELHALCTSLSTRGMVKSRNTRWTGHVAHMGEKMSAYRVLVGIFIWLRLETGGGL